jgi:hypothetical protein
MQRKIKRFVCASVQCFIRFAEIWGICDLDFRACGLRPHPSPYDMSEFWTLGNHIPRYILERSAVEILPPPHVDALIILIIFSIDDQFRIAVADPQNARISKINDRPQMTSFVGILMAAFIVLCLAGMACQQTRWLWICPVSLSDAELWNNQQCCDRGLRLQSTVSLTNCGR